MVMTSRLEIPSNSGQKLAEEGQAQKVERMNQMGEMTSRRLFFLNDHGCGIASPIVIDGKLKCICQHQKNDYRSNRRR
jgi:hypothetical protein